MDKRQLLATTASAALVWLAAGCTTTTERAAQDPSAKRRSIDADVESALARLYAQVPSARDLVGKAKGVLVMPSVISAGLGIGGSYGEGALRVGGGSAGYYKLASASVGLIAGAQSRAMFVLFMTQPALDRFRASSGWTAGVDASVAVATVGVNGQIDTKTLQQPVIGFVLTNVGLMANLSLEGARFIKTDF
ncbi:MAG TPA: YSC84-related protein [Albitalea sp.]|nr:YSC84-related protein [Albitalea sp.]